MTTTNNLPFLIRTLTAIGLPLLAVLFTSSAHADGLTFVHTDHLGTPVAYTNAAGDVIGREQVTPYGESLNPPTGNDQPAFTGHTRDGATGLVYMQARYYDPVTGRMLSADPVDFAGGGVDHFGRYHYANGNPVSMVDPTGMISRRNDVYGDTYDGNRDIERSWLQRNAGVLEFNGDGEDGNENSPVDAQKEVTKEVFAAVETVSAFLESIGLGNTKEVMMTAESISFVSTSTNSLLGIGNESETVLYGRVHKCCTVESMDRQVEFVDLKATAEFESGPEIHATATGYVKITQKNTYVPSASCSASVSCQPTATRIEEKNRSDAQEAFEYLMSTGE